MKPGKIGPNRCGQTHYNMTGCGRHRLVIGLGVEGKQRPEQQDKEGPGKTPSEEPLLSGRLALEHQLVLLLNLGDALVCSSLGISQLNRIRDCLGSFGDILKRVFAHLRKRTSHDEAKQSSLQNGGIHLLKFTAAKQLGYAHTNGQVHCNHVLDRD